MSSEVRPDATRAALEAAGVEFIEENGDGRGCGYAERGVADYREISQEYAKGGIRAAILLNSGASIAVLSQLSALAGLGLRCSVATAMLCWVFGNVAGLVAWAMAFSSTRSVDRSIQAGEPKAGGTPELNRANRYQLLGECAFGASVLLFLLGSLVLVIGFASAPQSVPAP
jgi:hypothetical protein